MKNQMVNLLKISGFAVVVVATASAAYGQGAAPRVAAPSAPTVTVEAPSLVTASGKAAQVTVRNAVNSYAVQAKLSKEAAARMYKDISMKLAAKERTLKGKEMTTEIARSVFMDHVLSTVKAQANKAAAEQMASVAFADAMATSTAADVANEIVNNQVSKVTGEQAPVKCDLVDSTRQGLAAADGLMSRDANLETAAAMQEIRTLIAKNATTIEAFYGSWPTVQIESFSTVNGKPVSFKTTGPVETADKWFAGSAKAESSLDVAEGYASVQTVMIDVKTGIGKSADQKTLWALSMGELTNRLTPVVGADQAAGIVYGQLLDPNNPKAALKDVNKDGKIDEEDGYVRGEISADGKSVVPSGISGKCAVNFGIPS